MQILWINIIMDGPPAQSLGVEPVDRAVAKRPPRRQGDSIIDAHLLFRVLTSAALVVAGTLWVHAQAMPRAAVADAVDVAAAAVGAVGAALGGDGAGGLDGPMANEAAASSSSSSSLAAAAADAGSSHVDGGVSRRDTTMTFTTFVAFDLFNAMACKSADQPVFALDQGGSSFGCALGTQLPY
jgi:magnesium-transporting ATPase (P-type)